LNISLQRQIPGQIILDATYFLNKSTRINNVNYNINQTDPRIANQYQTATNIEVANPFYHLPTPNKAPGSLWNRPTIPVLTLAKLYPQYGSLTMIDGLEGGDMTYNSLQLRATKSFSHGYTLLVGYNYSVQVNRTFYDNVDNYLKQFSSLDSGTPRHRLTVSGTWDLPVGKGRMFLTDAPRLLDALIGGWNQASTATWHSGTLLNFGGMLASGDPTLSNPGPNGWFDKSVFKQLPAFVRRTNPWYYSNIRGPRFFNIDATINKDFSVTERMKFQLHMDAFNAINNMNYNNPNMTVNNSQFGKSTDIYSQDYGRRIQLGLRLSF
jgi:hypothetical protein